MGVNLRIVEGPPGPPPDISKIVATLAWCPALAVASPDTTVAQIDSLSGLRDTLGYSIGSECVSRRYRISKSRGLLMSHLASVAGAISSITQTGLGPAMTVAADDTHPLDDASVIVRCKKGGAPGVAEVEISHGYNVIQQGNVQRLYGAAQLMPARLPATIVGTKDLTTIVYAKPAIVTGTTDVSDPTLYGSGGSLAGKTIIVDFDGAGSPTTYTIPSGSSAPADLDALVAWLNSQFGSNGVAGYTNYPKLTISGVDLGTSGEVDITGGTALSLLGLSVATTNGTAGALDGLTVILDEDTTTSQTLTFGTGTSAPENAEAIVAAFNALTNVSAALYSSQNYLSLSSGTIGLASSLAITGGTGLAALGLTASVSPAEGAESTITIEHLGVTCTFPAGTYRAGTTYAFSTKAPMPSVSEIEDRLAELDAAGYDFGVVHIAAPFLASDALALATALDALGAEWEAREGNPRAVHFVIGVDVNETDAVVKATFAGFRSRRVDIAARGAYVSSGLVQGGASLLRSQSWPAADADALIEFYQDRGERQLPALRSGFPEVRAITADENTASVKFVNPSGMRFNVMVADTPSTIHFKGGYSSADASSKFADASVRNVTNRGFVVLYQALKRNENRTDLDTESSGVLTESSAGKVETSADPDLRAALVPNAATDVRVNVSRTNDYYNDRTIFGSATIQNRVPARNIEFSIGPGLIVEG
jgi:hypothetical protein